MASRLKQRFTIILLLYLFSASLICCGLPLPSGNTGTASPPPGITPIVSPVLRPRVVYVLINTPPIFSLKYVRETEAMIADRVLSYIVRNH